MAEWKNWARTVRHSDLKKVFRPDNLGELKSNVREAAGKGWKLRAVGRGHAWSNLGVPARCRGAVIRTDKLAEFTPLSEKLVEVQGGHYDPAIEQQALQARPWPWKIWEMPTRRP